eukprot:521215-Pyramimonas_sp.AAC.1
MADLVALPQIDSSPMPSRRLSQKRLSLMRSTWDLRIDSAIRFSRSRGATCSSEHCCPAPST